jgi:alpha-1,2-mannosyltransferase
MWLRPPTARNACRQGHGGRFLLDEGQSLHTPARAARHPVSDGTGLAVAGGIVIFAASLAALAEMHVRAGSLESGMIDLRVYRAGGLLALHSGNLYGTRLPHRLFFTYPPMAALAFSAIAAIPLRELSWLIIGASIGSLTGALWITTRMLGYRRPAVRLAATLAAAGTALWLQPVWQTISLGQVNLILMLIILADLCLPETAWFKGVGVGLAAGFKLTPLIFIPYLLLTRRFRAAGVALATFMLTIAVSALALPGPSRQYWPGLLFLSSSRTGNTAYVGNQSLFGTMARLIGSPAAAQPYWLVVAGVVGVAGLLVAAWWSRRGQELAGILTCALTGLLICPVSWEHHWVWVAPGLLLAVDALTRLWQAGPAAVASGSARWAAAGRHSAQSWRRWAGLRWAWLAAVAVLAVPFFTYPPGLVPPSVVQGYGARGPQLLAGNIYVIAGLAILGLAGFALLPQRRPAQDRHDNGPERAARPAPAVPPVSVMTGGGPAGRQSPTE